MKSINLIQLNNSWAKALIVAGISLVLTLAAIFIQLDGGNVPYLVVANFLTLGAIAYLYGVHERF